MSLGYRPEGVHSWILRRKNRNAFHHWYQDFAVYASAVAVGAVAEPGAVVNADAVVAGVY